MILFPFLHTHTHTDRERGGGGGRGECSVLRAGLILYSLRFSVDARNIVERSSVKPIHTPARVHTQLLQTLSLVLTHFINRLRPSLNLRLIVSLGPDCKVEEDCESQFGGRVG